MLAQKPATKPWMKMTADNVWPPWYASFSTHIKIEIALSKTDMQKSYEIISCRISCTYNNIKMYNTHVWIYMRLYTCAFMALPQTCSSMHAILGCYCKHATVCRKLEELNCWLGRCWATACKHASVQNSFAVVQRTVGLLTVGHCGQKKTLCTSIYNVLWWLCSTLDRTPRSLQKIRDISRLLAKRQISLTGHSSWRDWNTWDSKQDSSAEMLNLWGTSVIYLLKTT